jgi:hypothetical protein
MAARRARSGRLVVGAASLTAAAIRDAVRQAGSDGG